MHIGGELPLARTYYEAVTDSGRSSLRLILDSGLGRKKFLLPDFLCGIVVDVLKERGVRFGFYKVHRDLSIDWDDVRRQRFDVLYCIDYFGQPTRPPASLGAEKTVLWDQVFTALLRVPRWDGPWCALNSLRKVTPLADGSFVRATFPLALAKIVRREGRFSGYKYQAKQQKAAYFTAGHGQESDYLSLFLKGERALDRQVKPYGMSLGSQALLPDLFARFEDEQRRRKENYLTLRRKLASWEVVLASDEYSFFVLRVPQGRDALRRYLFSRKIFLPAHWPCPAGLDNVLYRELLSIPLHGIYTRKMMAAAGTWIARFLKDQRGGL
ncbi:MAG: hypothetical protein HQL19_04860 [Candidatus Omnitrophica bacterium]|nr:hypothetical protein [Candidatus Omnitrophota bacterium]